MLYLIEITGKLIQIKKKKLCDKWRIRNPEVKRFTFRLISDGFIQRKLDYFFFSNLLQESVNKTDVLAAFFIDHSPLLFSPDVR